MLVALLPIGCAAPPPANGPVALRPLRADGQAGNGWSRDADLVHLDLALEIDLERRSVSGVATNRVRALLDGTSAVSFHALDLAIRSVTDEHGRALEHRLEEPLLAVRLAEPLARGEELSIAIDYEARPERGLYFVAPRAEGDDGPVPGRVARDERALGPALEVWSQGQEEDNRRWIPTWDYPNDRFTFSGRFRVGGELSVVSNGVLTRVEDHGGGERTFHWEMRRTLSSYLVAIAAGRWERYADELDGIPLEYYVAPGQGEERARRAFGETPAMMAFFSQWLGVAYPYEKYAQVAVTDFVYGGMENTTVTLQNDSIVTDADDALDLDGDPRLLVAHELAHHWFGDLVTCFGWSHLWLNEAWASYLELLFEREAAGEGSYRAWLERYRERYLARGADTALPLSMDWRSQVVGAPRCNHEYMKGPWVLHMLAEELGEDALRLAARTYLERHAEGLVTTEDFQRAVFVATGRNVEGFVEQWVEGGGHPVLRVRFDLGAALRGAGTLRIAVEQVQQTSELVPLFALRPSVDLHFAGGVRRRYELELSQARQAFELPLEGPLVDFVFDADCDLLCELELAKPPEMWAHQAGLAHAGARWRALAPLAALAGPDEAGSVAGAALARVLRADPEPLVRLRAVELSGARAPTELLLEAIERDADARVRLAAAHGLAADRLRAAELELLRARLAVERSPRVRERLEELLAEAERG